MTCSLPGHALGAGTAHLIVAGPVEPDDGGRPRSAISATGTGGRARSSDLHAEGCRRAAGADRRPARIGAERAARRAPRESIALAALLPGHRCSDAILGGVFGSRLNLRLREELGYTYGARAGFDARRAPGAFSAAAAVQTEVTADALKEMVALLTPRRTRRPTSPSCTKCATTWSASSRCASRRPAAWPWRSSRLAVYGLADDYWQTYRDRLEAVGAAEAMSRRATC